MVCHDVLEWLADPGQLLVEACRVLRPRGTAVWSHVDYEGVLVSGADRILTRRVMQAYVDRPAPPPAPIPRWAGGWRRW